MEVDNENSVSASQFRMPDIIKKKRDGKELTENEINWFIKCIVSENGDCEDAQIGAFLMAIFFKGMSAQETKLLTSAMMHSGDTLSWPESWRGQLVDKHSTGGVGDKVSLALAPALAACGMKVPMISGRGLAHTGGTLDKLESIPGYNVNLTHDEIKRVLEEVGCVIAGQTGKFVPADTKLYAIRDVTSTVDSLPLIVGSIISKKAAERVDTLILDVKCGKATFMKTTEEGRELAEAMVNASAGQGTKTMALLTRMDNPIGYTIGNSLEVAESLQCLRGRDPEDLVEIVCKLGGHLLALNGRSASPEEGSELIRTVLNDGSARAKFQQMLIAQGVDTALAKSLCENDMKDIDDAWTDLKKANHVTDIKVPKDGYVESIDAYELAVVSQMLGAGRANVDDMIDHTVGIRLFVSQGTKVEKGHTWIRVYHNDALPESTFETIQNSLNIVDTEVPQTSRIIEAIYADSRAAKL